jgi:hypothetical protein
MSVLHRCDNPPCVNPSHLFLGTQTDNIKDRTSKGRDGAARGDANGSRLYPERLVRGEQSPAAKLTDEIVRTIRALEPRPSINKLAAIYGTSKQTIWSALIGETWAHVKRSA